MLSEFVVTTERRGPAMIIGCRGELDLVTCARLDEVITLVLGENPRRLIFDGTGISLLSSSGIDSLCALVQTCNQRGIRLALHLSQPARRTLHLAGPSLLLVDEDADGGHPSQDARRDTKNLLRISSCFDSPNTEAGQSEYFLG
jgi:anti-anti-sigma factor